MKRIVKGEVVMFTVFSLIFGLLGVWVISEMKYIVPAGIAIGVGLSIFCFMVMIAMVITAATTDRKKAR